jgi:hypothetical protein
VTRRRGRHRSLVGAVWVKNDRPGSETRGRASLCVRHETGHP